MRTFLVKLFRKKIQMGYGQHANLTNKSMRFVSIVLDYNPCVVMRVKHELSAKLRASSWILVS